MLERIFRTFLPFVSVFVIVPVCFCCSGSGSFARNRVLAAANLDAGLRAAKCERTDAGIYNAQDLRYIAAFYGQLGAEPMRIPSSNVSLVCPFDSPDESCAWASPTLEDSKGFFKARFETFVDRDRFDCTSPRNFHLDDGYFLLAGGDDSMTEGSAILEAAIECQVNTSTLKFDYWSNNETPVLKICVVPEDTFQPKCEESRMDENPITFEIPSNLTPFRLRIQVDHIGPGDIVLIDNIFYQGYFCVVQKDDQNSKTASENTLPNTAEDELEINLPDVDDHQQLPTPPPDSPTTTTFHFSTAEELEPMSSLRNPDASADANDASIANELETLPPSREIERDESGVARTEVVNDTLEGCKALVCNFNYGDACFYRLSGLASTAAWQLGQSLLGNPHTGIHRPSPRDNTTGFVYVGLDGNDFSDEVFVLESAKFRLSEPVYLTFDLYQRSMGPQLKVCVNGFEDCPYSNPPLETTAFWMTNQRVLLEPSSEKVYFLAAKVRQNLYLALDNLRLTTADGGNYCQSTAGVMPARRSYHWRHR